MRDRPDADLTRCDGHHIGLEVVRTVDRLVVFGGKRIEEARDHFEVVLRDAGVVGRFLISFELLEIGDGNNRDWSKWLRAVVKPLVEVLRVPRSETLEKPDLESAGITRIATIECAQRDTLSVGSGYVQRFKPGDSVVENVLRAKDERLVGYRQLNGDHFHEYWLVIASIEPGTVEDGGYGLLMNWSFSTTYDRVFLIFRGSPPRAVEFTPIR